MKKCILFLSLFIATSSLVFANPVGFQNGESNKTNVINALKLNDDSYVILDGNIVKKISSDKYLFKDPTGTIVVEIDQDKWLGQSVNIQDRIEITGEIERKGDSVEIDVETIRKIK